MREIRQLNGIDNKEYGTKSANLGEAMKRGLLVPEGFALSFAEYDEYLAKNKIMDQPQEYMARGQRIQQQIIEGGFTKPFHVELKDRLSKLQQNTGCLSFIVRSSSILEDKKNSSMAGMFESYLKLTTLEEVEDAIRKCYASLFSDKAINFIYENKMDLSNIKIGVLVQEYISGEAFGVMFTEDPVSIKEDTLQFSILEGESTELVEKAASTAVYAINRLTGELLPETQLQATVIPDQELQLQLLDLAKQSEDIFGLSLDIEWTWRNRKLYLLQTRPITMIKKEAFVPEWSIPGQENYQWFKLYPTPLKPLMQDIMVSEIAAQSKAALETLFRTDTHGECMIQRGYAYVRSIPIEDEGEKRRDYFSYLAELAEQGICIYHDLHLPKLLDYVNKLNGFLDRELSVPDLIEFLKLSMEYHDYCARNHWPMVQANDFLYRYEKEFLQTYPDMALSDFYDLVSGYTLQTRDRELLFHMSQAVKKSMKLTQMFAACPYDAVLYAKLADCDEAQELLHYMQEYLKEYGICDSIEDGDFLPVLMERPDYILGYLRRLLEFDEAEFFHNLDCAKEHKNRVRELILSRADAKGQDAFLQKLSLAEKAFLSNDNHNYYVERLYRGYLRLAIVAADEYLRKIGILKEREDIQYLHYAEILDVLQGQVLEDGLIQSRRFTYEAQKRLDAPQLLAKELTEDDKALALEGYIMKTKKNSPPVNKDEPPMELKGLSGLKKNVKGTVFVGIPAVPQESILVMPHCHYGDIMPVVSKVKGLIFQWGSPYDHPAIIARELGIPAMYYVAGAMELLKTGDEVEIDGYQGIVRIIKKENMIQ